MYHVKDKGRYKQCKTQKKEINTVSKKGNEHLIRKKSKEIQCQRQGEIDNGIYTMSHITNKGKLYNVRKKGR